MDSRSCNGFLPPGRFNCSAIHLSGVLFFAILGGFLAWGEGVHSQQDERLSLRQVEPSYPLLRQHRPSYRNFAYQKFGHYPNHAFPYADQPQAFYNSMGDYLVTGYPIFLWTEDRRPGQEYGSEIFKDFHPWTIVFDNMLMARDGYGSWGYSAIVGDALIARFTPLTLSMANFNGLRVDVSTPHFDFTALGSRIERPRSYHETPPSYSYESSHFADDNTMLVASRMQTQIGNLRIGLNGTNLHVYRSTQPGNSLKGVVRSRLPLFDWLVVRFTDDSPADGTGGALVQDVQLVVNGEPRSDLRPKVVRHLDGVPLQSGTVSRATGEFRPIVYNTFRGYYQNQPRYYRGRQEVPLFADYLYRLDHEAGVDVSGDTNLEGLVALFDVESPDEVLRADGEEQLVFMFDLRQEPLIESVEVEALLGNDYRVEVSFLMNENTRARNHPTRYNVSFYQTVLRAPGNVQDGSNLRLRRFAVGEHTALFTYSADVGLDLVGVEINGEYARSARYSRYPAQREREAIYLEGLHSVERGSAYFVNATRWWGPGRGGVEFFSMNPGFATGMRTFVPFEVGLTEGNLAGISNQTVYWDLVEDNEDGDRYPDKRIGNLPGLPNDRRDFDVDGVFPGQDDDGDGFPDTNRNGNSIPDFEEPFLMFDVEPIDYAYGLDRNNNDEPDHREDDGDPDYPYDFDQRGYHLFGQVDLSGHWSLAAGQYNVREVAGAGRNRSTYALLTFHREGIRRLRQLLFENNIRRVQDDIPDETTLLDETPGRGLMFGYRGLERASGFGGVPIFSSRFRPDLLLYRDSFVNETFLAAHLRPLPDLGVQQELRLKVNWQQGGQQYNGLEQRDRRLDFWTWVSKTEYTWYWGKLRVKPQYKFILLRLKDQDADRRVDGTYGGRDLRYETRSIPILRLEYPLMSRTFLRGGVQGFGPLQYRVKNQLREGQSFEQSTSFITLTNQSRYFGYDLYSVIGVSRGKKKFDDTFQQLREFDQWSVFVRTLVGFTEYGRPI